MSAEPRTHTQLSPLQIQDILCKKIKGGSLESFKETYNKYSEKQANVVFGETIIYNFELLTQELDKEKTSSHRSESAETEFPNCLTAKQILLLSKLQHYTALYYYFHEDQISKPLTLDTLTASHLLKRCYLLSNHLQEKQEFSTLEKMRIAKIDFLLREQAKSLFAMSQKTLAKNPKSFTAICKEYEFFMVLSFRNGDPKLFLIYLDQLTSLQATNIEIYNRTMHKKLLEESHNWLEKPSTFSKMTSAVQQYYALLIPPLSLITPIPEMAQISRTISISDSKENRPEETVFRIAENEIETRVFQKTPPHQQPSDKRTILALMREWSAKTKAIRATTSLPDSSGGIAELFRPDEQTGSNPAF